MDCIRIKTVSGGLLEITTAYDPPPIDLRHCDWQAVLLGHRKGEPVGHGRTEQEAIRDLLGLLEEIAMTDEDEHAIYAENQRLAGLRPMTIAQWTALEDMRRAREAMKRWHSRDIADLY